MKLPTEVFGDVVVVHTPEEFLQDQAADTVDFLTSLEQVNIVLDLNGTENVDSAGLAALLDVHDESRSMGGDLKIVTCEPINRKILEVTRLDQRVEVYSDVIDAVKSFN